MTLLWMVTYTIPGHDRANRYTVVERRKRRANLCATTARVRVRWSPRRAAVEYAGIAGWGRTGKTELGTVVELDTIAGLLAGRSDKAVARPGVSGRELSSVAETAEFCVAGSNPAGATRMSTPCETICHLPRCVAGATGVVAKW